MASVTYTFTQSNGNATGWGNVGLTLPQVVSNKLSTPSTGTQYGGSIATGLTLTTYAEITVDFDMASGGACNVWLVDGSFNGYGIGWGSATGVRLQRLDAGVPTNVDTDAYLAGASGTYAFKFTRTSAGLMKGYVGGVEYLSATDTTYSTPATILISYEAAASVAGMDNLVVSDTASGGGATASPVTVGLVLAQPAAAARAGASRSPAVAALVVAQPAATARAGASSSPAVAALTVAQPAVSASGGSSGTTNPAAVALVLAQPAATPQAGSTTSPATAAVVVAQPAVTATGQNVVTPATAALVVAQPAASPRAGSTASPATAALVLDVLDASAGAAAYFYDDFNQADGTATGWTIAGTNNLYVKTNKVSTNNNSGGAGTYGGSISHGLDTSGDWRIDIMVDTALISGAGGVTVLLLDGSNNGYGVFAGNATHVQKYTAGVLDGNLTNQGRVGEGSAANLASWVTMTRRASDGLMSTYIDGVSDTGTATDTDHAGPFDTVYVFNYSTASPTRESTVDNLLISEGLLAAIPYPPAVSETASPAAAALVLAQPAVTARAGSSSAPATAALVLAVPAAAAGAGASAQPATATLTLTQPASTQNASSSVSPATAALTLAQPAVTASASGNATPTPGTVALTITQPAVTAGAGSTVTPATAVLTLLQPGVTATAGTIALPGVTTLTLTPQAAQALASSTASPAAALLALTQPAVTATNGAATAPATAALTITIPAASTTGGSTASPATAVLLLTPRAVTAQGTVIIGVAQLVVWGTAMRSTVVSTAARSEPLGSVL